MEFDRLQTRGRIDDLLTRRGLDRATLRHNDLDLPCNIRKYRLVFW